MASKFLERVQRWKSKTERDLQKSWGGLIVLFLFGLIEHRVYETANHFIDTHTNFSMLRGLLTYFPSSSFIHPIALAFALLLCGVLVILIHAYWTTRDGPLLRGEVTEAKLSTFGRGEMPWIMIFLNLRVTNEHQGMATIKNASLQLAIGQEKYVGKLDTTHTPIADDPRPNLLTSGPIQHAVGTVGWLRFTVKGLEMTNDLSGTAADTLVTLVDEFGVPHEIRGEGIRLY